MTTALVFGGWAVDPAILQPVFGDDAVYLDSNTLVEAVFEHEQLVKDWPQRIIGTIRPILPEMPYIITGWSMGSIIAAAIADALDARAFVGIASTPSFCRRADFRYGTRPAILRAMIAALQTDRDTTLQNFLTRCGLAQTEAVYTTGQLTAGLRFLEQACLLPATRFSMPALFLHGSGDCIIPVDAGRTFATLTGGDFREFAGSHAFFQDQARDVSNRVQSIR
jgi:surfactin synthase thioesterase subunit